MTGVDEAAAASVQLVGQVVVPLRPLPPPLPSPATKLRSAAAWVSAWVSAGAAAAAAHHGSSHGSRSSSHERRPGSSRRLAAPPPSPLRLAGSSDSLGTLSHASSDSFGSPLHGLSRPAGSYGSPSPGASPRDSCMAPAPPLVHAHSTAPPASFVVRELAPAGAAADGASLAWKQQLQVHQQQQQAQARLQQQKLQQTQKWASACGVYDSRMPPPPPPLWHVVL